MPELQYPTIDWPIIVRQIAAGSASAVEELYKNLRPVRTLLSRRVGPEYATDVYHGVIIDVIGAIQKGAIRQPDALPQYARTVANRAACARISEMIRERHTVDAGQVVLRIPATESPEHLVLQAERKAIATRILLALPPRDREMLRRFYLDGESQDEIKEAMELSDTQFRLIKSRAKARYTELVQQRMRRVSNRRPSDARAVEIKESHASWKGLPSPVGALQLGG